MIGMPKGRMIKTPHFVPSCVRVWEAWQEQWDTDDGALEPEEDLSEEEYWDSDGDGQDIKKARSKKE